MQLPLDLEKFLINEDGQTYLQKMSCDKAWGGDPELVALSHGLSRTIQVVTAAEKPEEAIRQFGDFDGSPILLGFADHHYYSLEPMQPSCDGLSKFCDCFNIFFSTFILFYQFKMSSVMGSDM